MDQNTDKKITPDDIPEGRATYPENHTGAFEPAKGGAPFDSSMLMTYYGPVLLNNAGSMIGMHQAPAVSKTAESESADISDDKSYTPRFCRECGSKLDAGVKFCPECGSKIK